MVLGSGVDLESSGMVRDAGGDADQLTAKSLVMGPPIDLVVPALWPAFSRRLSVSFNGPGKPLVGRAVDPCVPVVPLRAGVGLGGVDDAVASRPGGLSGRAERGARPEGVSSLAGSEGSAGPAGSSRHRCAGGHRPAAR